MPSTGAVSSVCSLNGYDCARPASSARNETVGDVVPAVMLSPNVRMREIRRLAGVEARAWEAAGGWAAAAEECHRAR